jgi:hypothetical protein
MEAKWSSLVSYGMSLDALQDFLPLDLSLDVKTVRYDKQLLGNLRRKGFVPIRG